MASSGENTNSIAEEFASVLAADSKHAVRFSELFELKFGEGASLRAGILCGTMREEPTSPDLVEFSRAEERR